MSGWHLTVEDFRRVVVAAAGIFGDKVPKPGDLMKLVRDNEAEPDPDPPTFVNTGFAIDPSMIYSAQSHVLRLRTALVEAHGKEYVDDLWARIRK